MPQNDDAYTHTLYRSISTIYAQYSSTTYIEFAPNMNNFLTLLLRASNVFFALIIK